MRVKFLILALVVAGLTLTGCGKQVTDWMDPFKVVPGKVTEFKHTPQEQLDVYVPLRDQYLNSKHATALETLNNYKDRKDSCYNCHSAEYRLAPQDAKPNVKQLSTSITCDVCHEMTVSDFRLRTTPLETCTQCHNNGGGIKAGQAVHHNQKEMFSGTGAPEVPDKPSTKYNAGLTCVECHMPNQSHTFVALTPAESLLKKVGSACMMCHTKLSTQEFAAKVTEVQNQTETAVNSLKKELDSLQKSIETAKKAGRNMDEAQKYYDVAFTDVSFVDADASKGIHNTEYARDILAVAQNKISAAKQALGK